MFDIHCHILNGVDDGSRTPAESHQMLLAARDAGIDHIVCTPHCKHSDFDAEHIEKRYRAFKAHAEKNGVRLSLGYEVHWKKLADMGLDAAPSLCIENTNLLLLEFSSSHLPANWQRAIYTIQGKGVDIVIAHPERYKPVQEDLDVAREMREMGCRLQLSANFVKGSIFNPRRRTATALLKNGLVDYLASDAHRVEHYATYMRALKEAQKY